MPAQHNGMDQPRSSTMATAARTVQSMTKQDYIDLHIVNTIKRQRQLEGHRKWLLGKADGAEPPPSSSTESKRITPRQPKPNSKGLYPKPTHGEREEATLIKCG